MIPNLKFKSAGHFVSQNPWRHPTVTLASWEFVYMTHGVAYLFVGDEQIELCEGDIALFPAGVIHGGYRDSAERVSFLWFHVFANDTDAAEYLTALPHCLHSVKSAQIPMMMRQLLHRANHAIYPPEMNDMTAQQIAMEYYLWSGEGREFGERTGLINKIREWIRINSDIKITVSSLAEEFSYNEDYITRYFSKKTGISLKSYIDGARMNLLRTKLLTTDLPLKKIASESGFEDYKAFLKFFTYHEGITPTEFRESCYMTRRNNK